ncbi:hypothetical protein E8E11_000662 [Didymella keratinophila]|nr:hypothetical protein E8E11_000662 [Didymella keratinophila]
MTIEPECSPVKEYPRRRTRGFNLEVRIRSKARSSIEIISALDALKPIYTDFVSFGAGVEVVGYDLPEDIEFELQEAFVQDSEYELITGYDPDTVLDLGFRRYLSPEEQIVVASFQNLRDYFECKDWEVWLSKRDKQASKIPREILRDSLERVCVIPQKWLALYANMYKGDERHSIR